MPGLCRRWMVFSCGKGAGMARGCDTSCVRVQSRIGGSRMARSDTETRTPEVFYLFVVETLNTGFEMYQPLVLQYGQQLDYFPCGLDCYARLSAVVILIRTAQSPSSWDRAGPRLNAYPSPGLLRMASLDPHAPCSSGALRSSRLTMGGETGTGRWLSRPAVQARWGWPRGGAGGERGHERGVGVGLVFKGMPLVEGTTKGGEGEGRRWTGGERRGRRGTGTGSFVLRLFVL
ncbi:hypothetical protein B0H13DRAFT_1902982 [Mycena leptocephala]|nr:hypothetical protein B0H13DRAFT_1902982 [Mycena leptocephala]